MFYLKPLKNFLKIVVHACEVVQTSIFIFIPYLKISLQMPEVNKYKDPTYNAKIQI